MDVNGQQRRRQAEDATRDGEEEEKRREKKACRSGSENDIYEGRSDLSLLYR